MSINTRALALAVGLAVAGGLATSVAAQQQAITSVLAPVTGTPSTGGTFTGTLFVHRFELRNNAILAVGTVSATFADINGFTRNVVTRVALPLDVAANDAANGVNAAIAQGSCEVLHLELESAILNLLGANIMLGRVGFDIATSQSSAAPAGLSLRSPSMNLGGPTRSTASRRPIAPEATPIGTGPFRSTTPIATSPVSVLRPGAATSSQATQRGTVSTAGQTQLGQLLCAVGRAGSGTAARAQVVQQLNQILTVLNSAS